jgi:taurine dioxygenase
MKNDLDVRPLAPACGAEVFGLDLNDPSDEMMGRVKDALAQHQVLFFRDQKLTPEQQVTLTWRLGPLLRVPYVKHMDEHPDVIAVLKEADEKKIGTFGGTWHSDFSFLDQPPSLTLLYAVELPPLGGDTLWASQYLAYENLSPALQKILEPLRAVQTGWPHGTRGPTYDQKGLSKSIKMVRQDPTADREVLHPIVRVHPWTGRKALFVNPVYTQRIEGWTEEESKPLLNFLFGHAVKPEFTCRLRWSPGTLAVWDNRSLMHLAINDYDGHRRLLDRTTVAGEVPEVAAKAA